MFFQSLLPSLGILVFITYLSNKKVCHKSVKTLSTHFQIFFVFHILSCHLSSYMQSSINFFIT